MMPPFPTDSPSTAPAIDSKAVCQAAPDAQLSHIRRPVWGLDCAACAIDVAQALSAVPGVKDVHVNPASQWADIRGYFTGSAAERDRAFATALSPLGCRLLDDSPRSMRDASQRSLRQSLFRLLLATLVWMQIMMYAWPEYSALPPDIGNAMTSGANALTQQDRALLRWAQWMLSIPLMLFCARPLMASAWRGLRRGRPGMEVPSAFALLAAFVVSSQATFSGQGPVWFDSLSMFLLFLLAARHIAEWLRHQSLLAVLQTSPDLPDRVERIDGDEQPTVIALEDLKPGDISCVYANGIIAADGILLDTPALVSEAVVTGEDRPVQRQPGQWLLAGSRVLSEKLHYRVQAVAQDSTVGQIAREMAQSLVQKQSGLAWLDAASLPLLSILIVLTALAGFGAEFRNTGSGWPVALAVLMVSCPCAIVLAAPAASIAATLYLRRGGVMVRNPDVLSVLPDITDVVFDKTGTLTQGENVVAVEWRDAGWPISRSELIASIAALSSSSRHPASQAVSDWACSQSDAAVQSELRLLAAVTEVAGCGTEMRDKSNRRWRLGSSSWCGAHAIYPDRSFASEQGDLSVFLSCEVLPHSGVWVPLCRMQVKSGLRPDTESMMTALRKAGLRIHLWSGDSAAATHSLAEQLKIGSVRSHMTPMDKKAHLQALQQTGLRVLMVGDGLNDGPVLAVADAAMALSTGSRLAQLQADAIVAPSQLAGVVKMILMSRQLRRITRQNLVWAVSYNLIAIPLAAIGFFTPLWAGVGMALSSLVVMLNSLRLMQSGDDVKASAFRRVSMQPQPH